MDTEEENFDHSAISKNRDHFERHRIAGVSFDAVLRETMDAELTSDDHFSSEENDDREHGVHIQFPTNRR